MTAKGLGEETNIARPKKGKEEAGVGPPHLDWFLNSTSYQETTTLAARKKNRKNFHIERREVRDKSRHAQKV